MAIPSLARAARRLQPPFVPAAQEDAAVPVLHPANPPATPTFRLPRRARCFLDPTLDPDATSSCRRRRPAGARRHHPRLHPPRPRQQAASRLLASSLRKPHHGSTASAAMDVLVEPSPHRAPPPKSTRASAMACPPPCAALPDLSCSPSSSPSRAKFAVVFFLRTTDARSGLCFEQMMRTPVSRRPSTAACPRPLRRQARRHRIHVSSLPVLVHASLHRPSASSSAVADKTEAARESPWLCPLRPCARMPRCLVCSR